jgi:hypothetical protein
MVVAFQLNGGCIIIERQLQHSGRSTTGAY